jgi:hypothetical protein
MAGSNPITPTTWNPADKGPSVTLSNGNLTAAVGLSSVRSAHAVSSGKWYWEAKLTGSSTGGNFALVGIGKAAATLTAYPGVDANGNSLYFVNGNKYNNATPVAYASAVPANVVVGVRLNLDAGTLGFSVGGIDKGVAFTGLAGTFHAMVGGGSSTSVETLLLNFGATAFTYAVPSGYTAGLGSIDKRFTGNVKDSAGANAAGVIYAYKENDGSLMGSVTSDPVTGNFTLYTPYAGAHMLVFMPTAGDSGKNALVRRGVIPVA